MSADFLLCSDIVVISHSAHRDSLLRIYEQLRFTIGGAPECVSWRSILYTSTEPFFFTGYCAKRADG